MAPSVLLMICATPELPFPAWPPVGHSSVSLAPSVHVPFAAASRYFEKLLVVPDASARCTATIAVLGKSASGLRLLIAASSQFLTVPWKIFASVPASSFTSSTPLRLYDTVIGAATVGKYRMPPPEA